jgi:AcrR family transcriptional regulator
MPYSPEHKRDTRQRILESARRLFNSKGFAEVSIGEVMDGAGLTHGGFYRHFADKAELYAEAVRWFLCREAPKPWQKPIDKPSGRKQANRIVDAYFSRDHFRDGETCCPMVGLAATISDHGVRQAYQEVLERMLRIVEADLPGPGARERALAVAALCVGGLVAARSVSDPALAHELREAAYRQARTMLKARPC